MIHVDCCGAIFFQGTEAGSFIHTPVYRTQKRLFGSIGGTSGKIGAGDYLEIARL